MVEEKLSPGDGAIKFNKDGSISVVFPEGEYLNEYTPDSFKFMTALCMLLAENDSFIEEYVWSKWELMNNFKP